MTAALIPFATFRPVSYRAEAGPFAQAPLGWVLHVVVGNGSPFGTFENAPAGSRRFSHLWVAKDGTCEQYAELTNKSWAQAAGNGLYWSVETEGFPAEALNDAQITTLARIHNFLGAADAVVDTVGGKGIGTHVMGGLVWGNHSCPGPVRAGQRQAVIDKARSLRAAAPVNHNTGNQATEKPWGAFPIPATQWYGTPSRDPRNHSGYWDSDKRAVRQIQREVHQLPDGDYGPLTAGAVSAYQRRRGLPVNGRVDVRTWNDMTQND